MTPFRFLSFFLTWYQSITHIFFNLHFVIYKVSFSFLCLVTMNSCNWLFHLFPYFSVLSWQPVFIDFYFFIFSYTPEISIQQYGFLTARTFPTKTDNTLRWKQQRYRHQIDKLPIYHCTYTKIKRTHFCLGCPFFSTPGLIFFHFDFVLFEVNTMFGEQKVCEFTVQTLSSLLYWWLIELVMLTIWSPEILSSMPPRVACDLPRCRTQSRGGNRLSSLK